ncbi:astacin-like metalloendopeptidase, partial [Leptotrombidium deliense]
KPVDDEPIYPEFFIPKTAEEAFTMQLNDSWYKVGPTHDVIKEIGSKNTPITSEDIRFVHAEIEHYACIEFNSVKGDTLGDFYTPTDFPVIVYNYYERDCKVDHDKIGRHLGTHRITIGGCIKENKRELSRAIMQVLGFIPEHRRGDRDFYVAVYSSAIEKQYLPLFSKLNYKFAPNIDMLEEPFCYDYYSIMHFGRLEYSKKILVEVQMGPNTFGQKTRSFGSSLVLKPLCKFDTSKMGGYGLSDRDQKRLQILYGCEKLKPVIDAILLLPGGRELFYYDQASGFTPWGYRIDITHHRPDPTT